MKYCYFYIFFNAYWSSFDVGEKQVPRQNAMYYMGIMKVLILILIMNTLKGLYGELLPFSSYFMIISITVFVFNYFVFSKKMVDNNIERYKFIEQSKKSKRLMILAIPFVILAGLAIGSGIYFSR